MNRLEKFIYVTEFKNEFDEWLLLHATRSKEKAINGAGRSVRIIECITLQAHKDASAEYEKIIAELEGALKYLQTIGCQTSDCLYKSSIANDALQKLKEFRGNEC